MPEPNSAIGDDVNRKKPKVDYGAIRSAELAKVDVIPPIKPGRVLNNPPFTSGPANPQATPWKRRGGRPRLKDVQLLARAHSVDALTALIGIYTKPNGKLDRTVDGRVVVAATSTVLKWAYGEPPTYDPNRERPDTKIDLEGMSLAERKKLLTMMDRITTVATDTEIDETDAPEFDATRFAEEPVLIDGVVVVDPPKPKPKMSQEEPRPQRKKKRKAKAVALEVKREPRKPGRQVGSGKPIKKVLQRPVRKKPTVSLFDSDF